MKHQVIETLWVSIDTTACSFLTFALCGGKWSAVCSRLGEGRWMSLRDDLGTVEKGKMSALDWNRTQISRASVDTLCAVHVLTTFDSAVSCCSQGHCIVGVCCL